MRFLKIQLNFFHYFITDYHVSEGGDKKMFPLVKQRPEALYTL